MRWQGKNIGLTYSQITEFTQEELYDYLRNKERNLQYLCVSKELHQDGGTHYHVHLQYSKKKDIKNDKYYDFKDKHPSIEALEHPDAWNHYIKKENQIMETTAYLPDEFDPFQFARLNDYETFIRECMKKRVSAQYASMIWSHVNTVCYEVTEETDVQGTMSPLLSIVDVRMPRKSYPLS